MTFSKHIQIMQPFTSDQINAVRTSLFERGETVQEFCNQHSLSYHVVMGILHGRSAATRGEGHRAAVLMGLKNQVTRKKRGPPKSTAWDGVDKRKHIRREADRASDAQAVAK